MARDLTVLAQFRVGCPFAEPVELVQHLTLRLIGGSAKCWIKFLERLTQLGDRTCHRDGTLFKAGRQVGWQARGRQKLARHFRSGEQVRDSDAIFCQQTLRPSVDKCHTEPRQDWRRALKDGRSDHLKLREVSNLSSPAEVSGGGK